MFEPVKTKAEQGAVSIEVNDFTVHARAGIPLAIALLEAGMTPFRQSPVSGEPRSPLCLMGVCFECLVEVDGRPNVQSCMIDVSDGMRVRVQQGARAVGDAA